MEPVVAPRPKRVWTVFAAFVLAIAFNLVAGFALLLAVAAGESGGARIEDASRIAQNLGEHPGALVASLAISSGSMVLFAAVFAALSRQRLVERLRLSGRGLGPIEILAGTMGALAIGQLFNALVGLFGRPEGRSALDVLTEASKNATPAMFAMMVVLGAGGAGVGEELFFRGYMQTRLCDRFGKRAGVALAATAFGLMHLDLLQSPYALVMGLYLGWIAESTGSVLLGVVVHVLNNAFGFAMARLVPEESPAGVTPPDAMQAAILVLAVSLPLFVASIWVLRRRFARLPVGEDGHEQWVQPTGRL